MTVDLILERYSNPFKGYRKIVRVNIPGIDNSESETKGAWAIRGYSEVKDEEKANNSR
jgi:hypothetical protein